MPEPLDRPPALLPLPRQFARLPGFCDIGSGFAARVECADARLAAAVARFVDDTAALHPGGTSADGVPRIALHLSQKAGEFPHPDGYRLIVQPDRIEIIAGRPAACFCGLQTLRQLVRAAEPVGRIACCEIVDWPDFTTRGLLHDVTRGKVPTLDTLKLLADRLAALKCNQLQLNIEHAFVFSFDPQICDPDEGLTPDEVHSLDAYCRERFIDLVPALATSGHMGRVLAMPKYRHLAEIEATKTWEEMAWPQRVRGFTLDVANPEAHRLIEAMWSDVLDSFSSPVVNICGDEPWDLGRGKNRERFAGRIGEAYLEHIRRTYDICAARGRHVQFWSDVVRNHPELFHLVPKDATVMHWGYDDRTDYAGTGGFVEAGLDTIVCPGTTGWKRILNGMNLAERNISAFATAGKEHGATGLVNTDWGDHGHFNLLACSWHGIALGAATGWRADHPIGEEYDRLFARHMLGTNNASIVHLLREAARSGDICETWRQLWMPMRKLTREKTTPSMEILDRTDTAAEEAVRALESIRQDDRRCPDDMDDLRVACEFLRLWAEKMRFVRAVRSTAGDGTNLGKQVPQWSDAVATATERYRVRWHRRNKPSGLRDIEQALYSAVDDIRNYPW